MEYRLMKCIAKRGISYVEFRKWFTKSHDGSAVARRTRKVAGSIPAPVKKPAPLKHEFFIFHRARSRWFGTHLKL